MTDFRLDQVDFESGYAGGPLLAGTDVSFDVAPWDIGAPQPAVIGLADAGCLTDEQRTPYAAALHRVTLPGARLNLLCFAETGNEGLGIPLSVTQADLRTHLAGHWNIQDIGSVDYTTSLTVEKIAAMGTERLASAGVTVDPSAVRTDAEGRILGRCWHLRADRA